MVVVVVVVVVVVLELVANPLEVPGIGDRIAPAMASSQHTGTGHTGIHTRVSPGTGTDTCVTGTRVTN